MEKVLQRVVLLCFLISTITSCDISSSEDDPYYPDKTQTIHRVGGVLLGSTGYYVITLKPLGSVVDLVFDGKSHTLTTDYEVKPEKAIDAMELTDGTMSIIVSTDETHFNNVVVTFNIPGHSIIFTQDNMLAENAVSLYTGSSSSSSGNDFINMDYNLSLNHEIGTFTSIQKITSSSEPGQVNQTETVNGSFKIENNKIRFSGNFGSLTLNYSPTHINYTEVGEGNYSFNIDLNKVY